MKTITKPFKGNTAFEWQLFMLVFMLYYPYSPGMPSLDHWKFKVWIDTDWKRGSMRWLRQIRIFKRGRFHFAYRHSFRSGKGLRIFLMYWKAYSHLNGQ